MHSRTGIWQAKADDNVLFCFRRKLSSPVLLCAAVNAHSFQGRTTGFGASVAPGKRAIETTNPVGYAYTARSLILETQNPLIDHSEQL